MYVEFLNTLDSIWLFIDKQSLNNIFLILVWFNIESFNIEFLIFESKNKPPLTSIKDVVGIEFSI